MINFIHRLLNPHCLECKVEREELKVCASCEILKQQLSIMMLERDRLLTNLLVGSPVEPPNITQQEPQVIKPKIVPWSVRRQMLEAEDRRKAELLRNVPKPTIQQVSIEQLEKEIGVNDAPQ
jgi:hypothetical protein